MVTLITTNWDITQSLITTLVRVYMQVPTRELYKMGIYTPVEKIHFILL